MKTVKLQHEHWQNISFWAVAFLRKSCHICSRPCSFHFCGFHNRTGSPALHPTPNLENQVSVCMSPSERVANYTPRQRVPFSSPSSTLRTKIETFEPASTGGKNCVALKETWANHSGRAVKPWTVFSCSNTGIVGSNTTQGMDVCMCLFCVCM
jgi:hypothetical protein